MVAGSTFYHNNICWTRWENGPHYKAIFCGTQTSYFNAPSHLTALHSSLRLQLSSKCCINILWGLFVL